MKKKQHISKLLRNTSFGVLFAVVCMPLMWGAQALLLPDTLPIAFGTDLGMGDPSGADVSNIFVRIMLGLAYLMAAIMGFLLHTAGWLFDIAVELTVVRAGEVLRVNDSTNQLLPGILFSWTLIRDVANLVFIFALMFIGIATILGLQSYGWRALAVRLVIAALLINFSLLFARVIIDVSNLAAWSAYGAIAGTCSGTACKADGFSMGEIMLGTFRLHEQFNTDSISEAAEKSTTGELFLKILFVFLFLSILSGIVIFVLLAGFLLLVIRFGVLVFLMIVSPIAFVGMILPQTRSFSEGWWRVFIKHALFAPMYFLCLFVGIVFLQGLFKLGGSPDITGTGTIIDIIHTGQQGADMLAAKSGAIVLLNFAVAAMIFLTALIVAAQVGVYGAQTALNMGKRWGKRTAQFTGWATAGATVGLTAATLRNTVGRAASMATDSDSLKNKATEKGLGGMAARLALKAAQRTASASFEPRQINAIGKLGFGTGVSGGYTAKLKKQIEKQKKFSESLGVDTKGIQQQEELIRQAQAKAARAEKIIQSGASRRAVSEAKKFLARQQQAIRVAEEQKLKLAQGRGYAYAETLEKMGRFGLPTSKAGVPRKRQKAAEEIRKYLGSAKERKRLREVIMEMKESGDLEGAFNTETKASSGTATADTNSQSTGENKKPS